jgi:hypothetical protein
MSIATAIVTVALLTHTQSLTLSVVEFTSSRNQSLTPKCLSFLMATEIDPASITATSPVINFYGFGFQ